MKVARVPASLKLTMSGKEMDFPYPGGAIFFFPEGKETINIFEMKEILEEMEKMSGGF